MNTLYVLRMNLVHARHQGHDEYTWTVRALDDTITRDKNAINDVH